MQAYRVTTADGIDAIEQVVMDTPTPASDEILVKMKACSLNYRDMLITMGGYVRNDVRPIVPLSDGAGEVVSVGSEVAIFNLLRIQASMLVVELCLNNWLQRWKHIRFILKSISLFLFLKR
ncbi:alcohol dehydrogenase catalytic domain-containing protein [Neptunomonas phycophila]|uniref:alcohol dehydrogenase catalytic domain-containing protein n=1 Tax=Neptunomonas phycophila TaxID=1572645 RepID=UPI0023F705ED|nr:alcohol dehydrogenase catalytic domain-containing protein [Neptunomonas phycophila]